MSKKDKLKEQIAMYKFWLGVTVAVVLSSAGWLISSYMKINVFMVLFVVFFILILSKVIFSLSMKINEIIDKLEDL